MKGANSKPKKKEPPHLSHLIRRHALCRYKYCNDNGKHVDVDDVQSQKKKDTEGGGYNSAISMM